MSKYANQLDNLKIASPCSANWDEMVGNERRRFCGQCNLNVYNLSGMNRTDAEKLLETSEGRLCIRFYKRADGTILTEDCPVGWTAVKRRVSKTATAFASLIITLVSGLSLAWAFKKTAPEVVGILAMPTATATPTPKSTPKPIPAEPPLMGRVARPTPRITPKPDPQSFEMGDIAFPVDKKPSQSKKN